MQSFRTSFETVQPLAVAVRVTTCPVGTPITWPPARLPRFAVTVPVLVNGTLKVVRSAVHRGLPRSSVGIELTVTVPLAVETPQTASVHVAVYCVVVAGTTCSTLPVCPLLHVISPVQPVARSWAVCPAQMAAFDTVRFGLG